MIQKVKKNNKGFTLVELIIVIAIIAILVAVLAPQYLQYVERARETHDVQVASAYMDAAVVVLTDYHTGGGEWYGFKWGYTTSGTGGMNIHMGKCKGEPTKINDVIRDINLQLEVAGIMGWENGKTATGDINVDLVSKPQSKAAAEEGNGGNSFIFYVNAVTGEILVDKTSAKWVNELGIDATLMS